MTKGNVIHTHILEFQDILQILSNAITVFNPDKESLLALFLQFPGILFRKGNSTGILVFLHISMNVLNQSTASFYGFLQRGIITLLLRKESCKELGIKLTFIHLLDTHGIVLTQAHTISASEP